MRDDRVVIDLVTRARNGDKQAWDTLVELYTPLIWSICRRYRLSRADAEDVGQSVWMTLLKHLDRICDPAALPSWLATTTRRECGRVSDGARGLRAAGQLLSAENIPDEHGRTAEQELLAAERHAALREALAQLPPTCQQLIGLLIEDPPVPYAEISARLGIPVSSIGPTRRRCLDKLRRYPAIAALISDEAGNAQHDTQVRQQRRDDDRQDGPVPSMPVRSQLTCQDSPGRGRSNAPRLPDLGPSVAPSAQDPNWANSEATNSSVGSI